MTSAAVCSRWSLPVSGLRLSELRAGLPGASGALAGDRRPWTPLEPRGEGGRQARWSGDVDPSGVDSLGPAPVPLEDLGEVRGGGAKPFRQKGTGNARQGSIRAPHYSGGGIALGPKPRSYVQKTPKKMIKLALRSALSDRASEGKVIVVDRWNFDTPSTKAAQEALFNCGATGKVSGLMSG